MGVSACLWSGEHWSQSHTRTPFTFHLDFVHPLQDVALHQCLPLSSACCFPVPGGALLLCYVVLPSSAWSSSWSLPSPWLPVCAAFGPPVVLHSCYVSGPSPLLFQCVFYNVNYLCSVSWSMSTCSPNSIIQFLKCTNLFNKLWWHYCAPWFYYCDSHTFFLTLSF